MLTNDIFPHTALREMAHGVVCSSESCRVSNFVMSSVHSAIPIVTRVVYSWNFRFILKYRRHKKIARLTKALCGPLNPKVFMILIVDQFIEGRPIVQTFLSLK